MSWVQVPSLAPIFSMLQGRTRDRIVALFPVFDRHPQSAPRTQGDAADRSDRMIWDETEAKAPREDRNHDKHLCDRQTRADANPRTDRKRQIGKARAPVTVLRVEPFRIEAIRRRPQPAVTVDDPWHDRHDRAARHAVSAHDIVTRRFTQ